MNFCSEISVHCHHVLPGDKGLNTRQKVVGSQRNASGQYPPLVFAGLFVSIFLSGCQTTGVENAPGLPTTYQDTESVGQVRGMGIESQDISSMVDQMVRHMLANPTFAKMALPPRVIVDSEYFQNQSRQRIDKDLLTDQLIAQLHIAANGRILFVNREFSDMVEQERALKRDGVTDVGTTGLTRAVAGADYRLSGRITSQDIHSASGVQERFMSILFQMTDLENGIIVWTNQYRFKKSAQDDVIYR